MDCSASVSLSCLRDPRSTSYPHSFYTISQSAICNLTDPRSNTHHSRLFLTSILDQGSGPVYSASKYAFMRWSISSDTDPRSNRSCPIALHLQSNYTHHVRRCIGSGSSWTAFTSRVHRPADIKRYWSQIQWSSRVVSHDPPAYWIRDQFWLIAQRRTIVGVMYYNQKLSHSN